MQQTIQFNLTLFIEGVLQPAITSLPNAVVGQPYTATVLVSGGLAPYTFSAIGLPAGLTMSAAGVISGTPTTAGSSTVAITVKDSSI